MIRFLTSLAVILCASTYAMSANSQFVTTTGTGLDKWASVWLLVEHFVEEVIVVERDRAVATLDGIVFDVPSYELSRDGGLTTYDKLIQHFDASEKSVLAMSKIIREIEIDSWRSEVSIDAQVVEQGFRSMQLKYDREVVTRTCYMQFFNGVYAHIQESTLQATLPQALIPEKSCLQRSTSSEPIVHLSGPVPTLNLHTVLQQQSVGEILFVDTRESWEFNEGHIPGAINMKLRDINEASVASISRDATIIAYCVKDFRGYEAALKMRSLGINAAIMTPNGMRGWVKGWAARSRA